MAAHLTPTVRPPTIVNFTLPTYGLCTVKPQESKRVFLITKSQNERMPHEAEAMDKSEGHGNLEINAVSS